MDVGKQAGGEAGAAGEELAFQEVRTLRVFEEICEQIRQKLASGALKPGDKLLAERGLALEFQVSRPAVREALRTLEISGVVTLMKGVKGGAFIRNGDPALLTRTLQDLMFLGRVSLRDLAEARVLINNAVIGLACERATEADFDAIDRIIDEIARTPDMHKRAEVAVQFFRLIASATRNEVLMMLVDSLSDIIRVVTDRSGRKPRPELVETRRQIAAALRARDAQAAMRGVDEYLAVVHEGMDVPLGDVDRPGRTLAAAARGHTVGKPAGKTAAKRVRAT